MGKNDKRERRDSSSEDERRDKKKASKDTETREEKMARRLAKKAAKRQKEEERKTICGYTDENNRFGDSQLTTAFTWHKKEEKEEEMNEKDRQRRELARKKAIEEEVEKVKRRREEREREQMWMEEEKARMLRMTEEQNHAEWEKNADKFHLEQSRVRAKIRIREGRAKPIDVLAKNLHEDDMDVEITEPYKLFRGLQVKPLEELEKDIAVHKGLDTVNSTFWEAMTTVCEDELQTARLTEARSAPLKLDGVHEAVQNDIIKQLKGKSLAELTAQEEEIKEILESDDSADNEFWEAVLKRLKVAKARAVLKDIHGKILRRRLEALESKMAQESINYQGEKEMGAGAEDDRPWDEPDKTGEGKGKEAASEESDNESAAGDFSPELDTGATGGEDVVDEAEDRKVLFNEVISLDHQVYSWHDKYRPRKPRFFNRVHTGYEWLENDSSPDTKILRFMAGPPYEDLAFRIVNKEWEFSHKRGFKCTFDRGILHLYFNFKRYRYRR